MPTNGIAWIDMPPIIIIDADGVRIESHSGKLCKVARMSRATFRRFMEQGIRDLDAYERAERERRTVIELWSGH